ncbi:FCD domain-containing protein [Actinoallomurus purpureus]|uniref:FadR/GntR family transcriptional regulator n=1 Tax=Actinoallomurus purpureus TaxID=478114 RepID=UPI002091EC01|nr:FCD domain-containing protein [Actinoallomurus purpureus]MCO6004354.1 FCD domain-containing protein [Actinoallomurus purpureus]
MSLQPVPRGSAVDAVLEQMHEQVASGAWAVGDRIPGEHELSAVLRVSRPAIREAIRALSHVGVLEVRRGDGTYVRSAADPRPLLRRMERASLRDVFEVQLAYDVQAAKLAATRRTPDDLRRLEALLRDRDAAEDPAAFGEADSRFHLGVAETARNPLLTEAFRFFRHRLRESLSALREDRDLPEGGPAPHHAVLEAIAERDADAAGSAAARVVEPTLRALEEVL